jgi:hypothetical protein
MPASYPSSAKVFTTKSDGAGNTILAAHINDIQLEVAAIEADLLAGIPVGRGGTGNTTLTANRVLLGNGTSAVAVAGAGTTGQVLTSNGASAPTFQSAGYTEETTTSTGATNNFDLDTGRLLVRCTGAAPIFSGFTVAAAAPTAGDVAILECLGTTLKVSHQDTNSTAENRIICQSTTGQIVGVGGRILLVYDGTTDRWRATVLDPGTPITPTFAAGDFTATGGGSWTVAAGDVATFAYQQRGKTVHLRFQVNTTTVAGTVTSLNMTLPNSWALTKAGSARIGRGVDNSSALDMYMQWAAAATAISILTYAGANFTAATDTTYVAGEVSFEVD